MSMQNCHPLPTGTCLRVCSWRMKEEPRKDGAKALGTGAFGGWLPSSAFGPIHPQGALFQTTHWSVVLEVEQEDSVRREGALEQLCKTYWAPVYAFIRRSGRGVEDAQDLTQSFFAHLLEHNALHDLDPRKGKFRSFLLVILRHFLTNDAKRASAAKRGGGRVPFPLEAGAAEDRFLLQSVSPLSPEQLFDRNWALAVLDQAFGMLRSEFEEQGMSARFERLKVFLWHEGNGEEYAKAGVDLLLTPGAVKMAVHRLRHRYGELLRGEVARTVESPFEIEAEMRYLLDLLIQ
jgi:DNA-directed RNA polymerase specialized sigma24 family protein